jgi:serine/threonine protein kinase
MSTSDVRPEAPPAALPPGTRLGEFELQRVLGVGGFGIVYLAFDHALEREVAVKEYMPSSLAGRTATLHVSLRSQSDADTFALGLKSFVNEARLLARFDHPSLLKVHRFWEANGTAYMAMPVYRGRTIKDVRAQMAMAPDEGWLRQLLVPLLGAIETLHDAGVYHRDIAPDNILIEADGRPVLLDFGAARRVISDKSQTLTAILKPAYAPIEQYAEAGSVKQGPWTDIYALGATMHYMLLGRPPSPATARAVHDDQAPLSGQAVVGCSEGFLHIVDWMLAPRPTDRPQSVAALRDVIEGRAAAPVRAVVPPPPSAWERTLVLDGGATTPVAPPPAGSDRTELATVVVPRRVPPAPPVMAPPPPVAPPPATPPAASAPPPAAPPPAEPAPSGNKLVPVLLGVVAVAAIGGVVFWPRSAPAPAVDGAASAPPLVAASAAAVPVPAPPPVVVAAPPPEPVASVPAGVAVVAPPPARPEVAAAPPPKVEAKPVRPPAPPPRTAVTTRPPEVVEAAPPVEAPKPPPVATTPAPPPPAPAPAPVATGPKERCGSRILVALLLCMERECATPELRQHPECVRWRADKDAKANPQQ